MDYVKKLVFFLLGFHLCCLSARADTFTVTTNADSGPGSLRACLEQAAANGTAIKDYIHFNITGAAWADRTIVLESALPALSGNLVIDGSTQPTAVLGISTARVIIRPVPFSTGVDVRQIFQLTNIDNVEIYGLALKSTIAFFNDSYGIKITGGNHITIGAPGKGNLINGFSRGISQDGAETDDIKVQSNIIGIEEDGETSTIYDLANMVSAEFHTMKNLLFGGMTAAEGNLLVSEYGGIYVSSHGGAVQVVNNRIGTNAAGTVSKRHIDGPQVYVASSTSDVYIADNLISGDEKHGIYLANHDGFFEIVRNKIGTDITGAKSISSSSTGILLYNCSKRGYIGGTEANANIIATGGVGISVNESYQVTISKNEMFCNYYGNINLYWQEGKAGREAPFVNVTYCNATAIGGKATPNATLELFAPYNCSMFSKCDGRKYLTSMQADANGNWSYNFPPGITGVILTATDAFGATSEYSTAKIDQQNLVITHTACGQSTGSITGISVLRGHEIHWEDLNGNIVGSDTALKNVPAGQYVLAVNSAGCNKPECKVLYGAYMIEDKSPSIDRSWENIRNSSCGQKNGSITNVYTYGLNLTKVWTNAAGQEVGQGDELLNVGPGAYHLTITDAVNGCSAQAGPFIITNADGPTIDVSGATLAHPACGQPAGSIGNIIVSGTGVIQYTWKNASGATVGSDLRLQGVPAGKYVLHYADESSCPAAESDTFELRDIGAIVPDYASTVVVPNACNAITGGVTGIRAQNAETYTWTDASGTVVGRDADLANVPAGSYDLLMENATGCSATKNFRIPQSTAQQVVHTVHTRAPYCGNNVGTISVDITSGPTPASYRWSDASGTVIGTTNALDNLGNGTYTLHMTDRNGCEQKLTSVTLLMPPLPTIDQSGMAVKNDECQNSTGAITGIRAMGAPPFSYAWQQDGDVLSTDANLANAPAGRYILKVTDTYGCIVESTPVFIGNINAMLPPPDYTDLEILAGMDAVLKVNNRGNGTYQLFAASGNSPLATSTDGTFHIPGLTQTTNFQVILKKGDCASSPETVTVKVVDEVKVVLPNAFTPNGDGVNDVFRLRTLGLQKLLHFTVYDRWGNTVFTTRDLQTGWDGKRNGVPVSRGTYVWFLQGIDLGGREIREKGTVSVL